MKKLLYTMVVMTILLYTIPASAFQLDAVPYIQIHPVMLSMERDTRPLGAIGIRFEAKDMSDVPILRNAELFFSLEGGKIDSMGANTASDEEIWKRCQYGCPPSALWNKWQNSADYFSIVLGIQYRIDMLQLLGIK